MERKHDVYCDVSRESKINLLIPVGFIFVIVISGNAFSIIGGGLLFLLIIILFFFMKVMKKCYFLDEYIKVVYPMDLKKRNRIIYYSEIKKVRYVHAAGQGLSPFICIEIINTTVKNTCKLKNYFPLDSKSERKTILQFLYDKKVAVEIKSEFKEDDDIIEYR